jgi:hypothetical protein
MRRSIVAKIRVDVLEQLAAEPAERAVVARDGVARRVVARRAARRAEPAHARHDPISGEPGAWIPRAGALRSNAR